MAVLLFFFGGGGGLRYINHPLAVARTLAEVGIRDLATLQAALLHDTLEDVDQTGFQHSALSFEPLTFLGLGPVWDGSACNQGYMDLDNAQQSLQLSLLGALLGA